MRIANPSLLYSGDRVEKSPSISCQAPEAKSLYGTTISACLMSFPQTAILDTEHRESPGKRRGFSFVHFTGSTRAPLLLPAPVVVPAGEAATAELQPDLVLIRIQAWDRCGPFGVIDFRAVAAGEMGERRVQRRRGRRRRHAELKRQSVRTSIVIRASRKPGDAAPHHRLPPLPHRCVE